jgi:uncharacterized protein
MSRPKTIQINIVKSQITQSRELSLDCHTFFRPFLDRFLGKSMPLCFQPLLRRSVTLLIIGVMSCPLMGCLPDEQKQPQEQPQATPLTSSPNSSPSETAKPTATPTTTTNPVREDLAQFLPIGGRLTISNDTVKGEVIDLEVAKTPEQQSKGLMYRPALAPNRGMLFAFPPGQVVAFWMKNVPVDLDMVFVAQGKIVAISTAVPCVMEPCALYPSDKGITADQVIELRAGRARELGLKIGDPLTVELLAPLQ